MYKKYLFVFFKSLFVLMAILFLIFIAIPWVWNVVVYSNVPYDTSWIHGKTAGEIIQRYGEPCCNYGSLLEYDLDLLFRDEYYYIEFGENGLADDIYIRERKGG